MRILQISSARAFGGGERHLLDLTRGLAERGHELFVALSERSGFRDRFDALPPSNVFTLPLRNALDLPSALALARLARSLDVDIVHAHLARDYPLAAFATRRHAARSRLVVTRHVLFPLGRAHRLVLANVSRVIAVSEAVARALRAQRIFPGETIRVVPNAVDFERFETARELFERENRVRDVSDGGVFRVGSVGSLSEVKGHDVFVRAAALVASRMERACEFIIVGDEATGSNVEGARIEKLIRELGLEGSVRIITGCEDVARVLPGFDLFVSASRSEAFGLAMVEAMACGVPVIATSTEGALEIIDDGATGLLVPIDDERAIADAVLALAHDPERRASLASRALASARERFSLTRMIDDTERVYFEAMNCTQESSERSR